MKAVEGLVSIIIPVLGLKRPRQLHLMLRRPPGLRELMGDLERQEGVDIEVIVVCNDAGNRDVLDFVKGSARVDKFCLNSHNAGVPRSWNLGAQLAEGDYLCFINDDVELKDGCLQTLRDVFPGQGEDVGMAGPQGGRFFGNGDPGERLGLDGEIAVADEISGWLFMVRRQAYDQAGGFDIRYSPAGYEEVDFAFRIRELGWRCLVVPQAMAIHHGYGGVSSSNTEISYLGKKIGTDELNRRNRQLFRAKWDKPGCGCEENRPCG